eukprot:1161421-Pelagomonas_calceolata.AAC.10
MLSPASRKGGGCARFGMRGAPVLNPAPAGQSQPHTHTQVYAASMCVVPSTCSLKECRWAR